MAATQDDDAAIAANDEIIIRRIMELPFASYAELMGFPWERPRPQLVPNPDRPRAAVDSCLEHLNPRDDPREQATNKT